MAYIFRLILLCIPLFGAVAATAEAQRIDRVHSAPDMVLALNTVSPVMVAAQVKHTASTDQASVTNHVMAGASTGLPLCLALVLLVSLVRQRA